MCLYGSVTKVKHQVYCGLLNSHISLFCRLCHDCPCVFSDDVAVKLTTEQEWQIFGYPVFLASWQAVSQVPTSRGGAWGHGGGKLIALCSTDGCWCWGPWPKADSESYCPPLEGGLPALSSLFCLKLPHITPSSWSQLDSYSPSIVLGEQLMLLKGCSSSKTIWVSPENRAFLNPVWCGLTF